MGDALHGVVLWRKADIKLTASTTAPVQTDRPSSRPPSPPSPPGQRATSTPTPPAPEKGKKKIASLPAAGPSKKKQKAVKRKLSYEKTTEQLGEETARYIKEQLKPKVPPPRENVPLELGKKLLANLDNPPKPKSLPSDFDRTLIKAHKVRNLKKNVTRPFLSLAHNKKNSSPSRVASPTPDGRTTTDGPTSGDISFKNWIDARAGNRARRGSRNPCRSLSSSIRAWKTFCH